MNQTSGGVESRHAAGNSAADGTHLKPTGVNDGHRERRCIAGVAPGPLDLFIRYRRVVIVLLLVLLGLARWLGDGNNPSW